MGYKIFDTKNLRVILFLLGVSCFFGCEEREKTNTTNTYYVEMVNFKDTLKTYVTKNIFGKASFFKNNKIELVSANYLENDYPDIHYYKSSEEFEKTIKPDSKKIRIELRGNYTTDSTSYSIQRFKYNNNNWIKTSDIGFIKATATSGTARELTTSELGDQIITNLISSTY